MITLTKRTGSLVLLVVLCAGAQTQASFVYVESFRKGATKVLEQSFQVDLDAQNPTCQIRVKDEGGKDRYLVLCAPQRVGEEDNRILGWHLRLADLRHKIYSNVLMSSPDAAADKAQIGWLDPSMFAKIPLTTERVIKIDNFYCVIQVKDHRFVFPDSPYLERMSVAVRFTNTLPHSEVTAGEAAPPS